MNLTEILAARRSTRRFEPRPVERAKIEALLRLTLTAPSSKNSRSTRFAVVTDPAGLETLATMRDFGSAFLASVPCAIIVCGDPAATDLWVDNAAIAATILQLAAIDAGLASCWVHINGRPQRHDDPDSPPAEARLRASLPLPEEWKPLCAIALGYPAEPPKPHRERDEAEKIVWL